MDRYRVPAEVVRPELCSGEFSFRAPVATAVPRRGTASMTEWVLPAHTNARGFLFGGVVASWIDIAGVAAAQRYARAPVVTVSIDRLHFITPVRMGCLVLLEAHVSYVGRTSIEVEVLVDSEDTIAGNRERAVEAYVTYVALDESGVPRPVPSFTPQTPAELARHREAEKRRALRPAR